MNNNNLTGIVEKTCKAVLLLAVTLSFFTGYAQLNYSCIELPNLPPIGPPVGNNPCPEPGCHIIDFSWRELCPDANFACPSNYEIQILRLYNTDPTKQDPQDITAKVDWSQALRVVTNEGPPCGPGEGSNDWYHFKLSIAEGTGFYVWRVRRIEGYWPYQHGDSVNFWTKDWTPAGAFVDGATVNVDIGQLGPNKAYLFYYTQFDDDVNWIYRRSIGDGEIFHRGPTRIKEKVTYANPLLMPIQEISLNKSGKVVTNTIYDYSGRPSMQTIPAPGDSDLLYFGYEYDHTRDFAGGLYTSADYDTDNNYNTPSTVTGPIEHYFSDINPDLRVANAEGYPYNRTLYYNDKLNRPREIATAGPAHTFGSGNTVRKWYTKATSTELIRLFGDEAPKSASIVKTYTEDPNGTYSVTYTDEFGRTLATCLTTPRSLLLDSIPGSVFMNYDTVTNRVEINPRLLLSKATYAFAIPTKLDYLYEITPKVYGDECLDLCATCDYKIRITAKERYGTDVYEITRDILPQIDSVTGSCTSLLIDTTDTYQIPDGNYILEEGTYDVNLFLEIKNSDPTTNQLYIDSMVSILHRTIDNEFWGSGIGRVILANGTVANRSLATVKYYLEHNDMNNLINYLGVDTSQPYFKMLFNNDCDTVELPTARCPQPDCADPKFSEFMKEYLQKFDEDHDTDFYENVYNNTISITTDTSNMFLLGGGCNGDDEFNDIIKEMIADGYDCNELWEAWVRTIVLYAPAQMAIANTSQLTGSTPKFDWWDLFMENAGYKKPLFVKPFSQLYSCTSDVRKYPYKYFPYDWHDADTMELAMCAASGSSVCTYSTPPPNWYININNFPTSPSSSPYHMFHFYQGIKKSGTYSNGSSSAVYGNFSVTAINNSGGTNTSLMNPTQFNAMSVSECFKACEDRLDGLMSEVVDQIHGYGMQVEGYPYPTWRQTPGSSVMPITDVYCMANSVVERCKSLCDLTPDSSGYLSSTKMNNFGKALSYDIELYVHPDGSSPYTTCSFQGGGYFTVQAVPYSRRDFMLKWLNKMDKKKRDSLAAAGVRNYNYSPFSPPNSLMGSPFTIPPCSNMEVPIDIDSYLHYESWHTTFDIGEKKVYTSNCTNSSLSLKVQAYDSVYISSWAEVNVDVTVAGGLGPNDSLVMTMSFAGSGLNSPIGWGYLAGQRVIHGPVTRTLHPDWYKFRTPSTPQSHTITYKAYKYSSGVIVDSCIYPINFVSVNCIGLNFLTVNTANEVVQGKCANVCFEEDSCGDRRICMRWVPPLVLPVDSLFEDTLKPITCGMIVCRAFENTLNSHIETIHKVREAKLREDYKTKCLDIYNIDDLWVNNFEINQYVYTLYYYDRAGNLVRTVAPEGVDQTTTSRNVNPPHTFVTEYDYNTLGQMVRKKTPEAENYYMYDKRGRLRFITQGGVYSKYLKYDFAGRVIETGRINGVGFAPGDIDNPGFPVNSASYTLEEVTRTVYSEELVNADFPAAGGPADFNGKYQQNIFNKISYVQTDVDGDFNTKHDQVTNVYSYDPLGNVKCYYTKVPGMKPKLVRYYNNILEGTPAVIAMLNKDSEPDPADNDAYSQKFMYDDDMRLAHSFVHEVTGGNEGTGSNVHVNGPLDWNDFVNHQIGRYEFDKLGRLRRSRPFHNRQGIDYTYTIEGWLKAINSSIAANDPGNDWNDQFGMVLNYYEGDFNRYEPGTGNPSPHNSGQYSYGSAGATIPPGHLMRQYIGTTPGNPFNGNLFNGNISSWEIRNGNYGMAGANDPWAYVYRYDELNRITAGRHYNYDPMAQDWFYQGNNDEEFTYDDNGNILTASRMAANGGMPLQADNLQYNYATGTNQLSSVTDLVSPVAPPHLELAKSGGFGYDAQGRITTDVTNNLSIDWRHDDKIKSVTNTAANTTIDYLYDGQGNRVKTTVTDQMGNSTETYYTRTADGNTLGLYEGSGGMPPTITERYLYGTDRVGKMLGQNWLNGAIVDIPTYNDRRIELKDHLGNVRTLLDGAMASVTDIHNYYAFGGVQPELSLNPGNMRYGFNGMEQDIDLGGIGSTYDFSFRMYDAELGRFLSHDPLAIEYPWNSPYAFAENRVIDGGDLEGKEYNPMNYEHGLDNLSVIRMDRAEIIQSVKDNQAVTKQPNHGTFRDASTNFGSNEEGYLRFKHNYETYGQYMPGLGDIGDIYEAGKNIQEGNYFEAGIFILAAAGADFLKLKKFIPLDRIQWGDRVFDNWDEFRTVMKSADDKIAAYKKVAGEVAEKNGWKKNTSLMKKNGGRTIYTDEKGMNYALDTEKGTFEVVNKRGKHQGEINFEGVKIEDAHKDRSHDLIVD